MVKAETALESPRDTAQSSRSSLSLSQQVSMAWNALSLGAPGAVTISKPRECVCTAGPLCAPGGRHCWGILQTSISMQVDFEEVLVILCTSIFLPGLLELACGVSLCLCAPSWDGVLGILPVPIPLPLSALLETSLMLSVFPNLWSCPLSRLSSSPACPWELPSSQQLSWQLTFLGKLSAAVPGCSASPWWLLPLLPPAAAPRVCQLGCGGTKW